MCRNVGQGVPPVPPHKYVVQVPRPVLPMFAQWVAIRAMSVVVSPVSVVMVVDEHIGVVEYIERQAFSAVQ